MVWVSTWREVLEALGRALLTVLPAECFKMCNELEDIVACWSHKGSWYAAWQTWNPPKTSTAKNNGIP